MPTPIRVFPPAMWVMDRAIRLYLNWYVRDTFVWIDEEAEKAKPDLNGHPIVVVVNHISRFDGFAVRLMQKKLWPERRFITIMLERELKKHPYFRIMGAVGIAPGSLQSGRRIKHLVDHEMTPTDCICIFPQGRIEPQDADVSQLDSGFSHLAMPKKPSVFIPVALALEPLIHPKPTLFVRVGRPVFGDSHPEPALEDGSRGVQSAQNQTELNVSMSFRENLKTLRSYLLLHSEKAAAQWPGNKL